jgi:hypothetical protein
MMMKARFAIEIEDLEVGQANSPQQVADELAIRAAAATKQPLSGTPVRIPVRAGGLRGQYAA